MTENLTASQRQMRKVPAVADLAPAPDSQAPIRRLSAGCGFLPIIFLILGVFGSAFAAGAATPPETVEPPARGFVFSYVVKVKMPASSHSVHARIPLPATDEFQTISELRLQAPAGVQISEDYGVGLHYADFSADPSRVKGPFEVHVTFTVVRYERRVNLTAALDRQTGDRQTGDQQTLDQRAALPAAGFADDVMPFLQADRRSPIDQNVETIARQQTQGITDPLQKARKIFDYVISAGDPALPHAVARKACDSRGADCTGFNSLFVSLARAAGIPARLEIGFSFPDGEKEGAISGYHSWVEFFVNGVGWIPLDASQASEEPEKRNDFFGSIDARRVVIVAGRDSQLTGQTVGQTITHPPVTLSAARLNDLVDPQVEIDGKPSAKYSADFLFQEADIAGPTSSSRHPVFARRYEPAGAVAGG